jgi:hypothetical protein
LNRIACHTAGLHHFVLNATDHEDHYYQGDMGRGDMGRDETAWHSQRASDDALSAISKGEKVAEGH